MKRREFLLSPVLLGLTDFTLAKQNEIAYITASQSRLGENNIICLTVSGEVVNEHIIPSRGHSFAISPAGHIAAIARRPAHFCLILDQSGNEITRFNARPDRHFYGHGVFDSSGDYLFLTENDFDRGRGVIGVYDVTNDYQRVNEFDSYGVGPHEIQLSADGDQLIVANGGIKTHPNTGRKKLNIEHMRPSIAFIDQSNGDLLRSANLDSEYHANSIRHLAVADDGIVYIGCQNQDNEGSKALVLYLKPGDTFLHKIQFEPEVEALLENYVGDIALDASHNYLAVTSPVGNTALIHSIKQRTTTPVTIDSVCAIGSTNTPGQFIFSSELGEMVVLEVNKKDSVNSGDMVKFSNQYQWDNHILVMR